LFAFSYVFLPVAYADEIRLLSANVFTGVLDEPIAGYGRGTGQSVVIVYGTAGAIRNRIRDGEFADVTILPRPMMDDLQRTGKIGPGITDLARSAVGVAMRPGSAKPDISSVEALKRSLSAAHSISYADPARGGATGVLITRVLERLGMTADMKPKTKFPPDDQFAVDMVARGEADIALAQPMEVVGQPGVELVGLLPAELQDPPNFTFSMGALAASKEQPAAAALIQFLSGPAMATALKARGMEPR
jgi:molybdate transport system substrate-binding protein